MKHIVLSMLTVVLFMATSVSNTVSARRPTCGTAVNGHTVGGNEPTEWCPSTDLPVFPVGSHTYSKQATTCPIDQTPLLGGHSHIGG